jgi:rhamnosyltransferase
VCAIVVTHFPDAGLAERLAGVAAQVDEMLVVDNGSRGEPLERLRGLSARGRIRLLENGENRGVATALNQGARWAAARGFDWIALFDQDTRADPDLVRDLLAVYAAHPRSAEIGVVGARPHAPAAPAGADRGGGPPGWRACETVITSGSLLRVATLARVGPFRDEFFVDHVDDDYCLRLAARGFLVLQTARPLMQHAIGAPTPVRLPWKHSQTSNHSAERRYFMTRNHVVLIREHWRARPRWVLRSAGSRLRSALLMLAFERGRGRKLAAIAHGLADGCAGRLGARGSRGPRRPQAGGGGA